MKNFIKQVAERLISADSFRVGDIISEPDGTNPRRILAFSGKIEDSGWGYVYRQVWTISPAALAHVLPISNQPILETYMVRRQIKPTARLYAFDKRDGVWFDRYALHLRDPHFVVAQEHLDHIRREQALRVFEAEAIR